MKIMDFNSLLEPVSFDEAPTPMALNGRELQEILSPLSCEEFVNTYFSRVSLHVEGPSNKFEHIFSWEKLKRALAIGRRIPDKRFNIMASFAAGEASGSRRPMFEAYCDQVGELLNAGATICITNIHMADPLLARWAQAIREQLNFSGTVGINCYVSADGSGLPMHYDQRVATTLQIAGKKRWKFSTEAAKAWPNHNALFKQGQVEPADVDVGKLPADMEIREVELSPGDLLCLPAGAWHSACGVGHSLALNLYFSPRNLLDQLVPLFHKFAVSNGDWRGGPPASAEKIQGQIPEAVKAYMRERLDEFHKMALEIMDSPDALTETWLSSLTQNPYTGWQPAPNLPIPGITPDQRFCVATPTLRFVETGDKVTVPCDSGVIRFPATFAPVLHRLSSGLSGFTIPDVLSWQQKPGGPSPNETMAHLQTLFKNGIIKMV